MGFEIRDTAVNSVLCFGFFFSHVGPLMLLWTLYFHGGFCRLNVCIPPLSPDVMG